MHNSVVLSNTERLLLAVGSTDRLQLVIPEFQLSGYQSILDSSACLIEAGISVDLRVFGSKNTSTVS